MNDNDIINALVKCSNLSNGCSGCPLYSSAWDDYGKSVAKCEGELIRYALVFINRQKAEIERLEAECEKQYEQATADILGNIADGGTGCHWCMEQHEAKAIKEFSERLKSRVMKCTEWDEGGWDSTIYAVKVEDIENLVEKMTEE